MIDGNDIRFTRLTTAEGLSQTMVTKIAQDNQGFMWFGTQYGLDRYDGYNFKVFLHDPKETNSLSGVLISELFKDRDGALWIGCGQSLDDSTQPRGNLHHSRFRLCVASVRIARESCG